MFQKNPKEKTIDMSTFPGPRKRSCSVSSYRSPDRFTSPVTRQRRRSSSISIQPKLGTETSPFTGSLRRRSGSVSMSLEGGLNPLSNRRRSSSVSIQDLTKNVNNVEQLQMLHAVYQDDIDQVWELLESGADPNLTGSEGSPLLHIAVETGSEEMVRTLLNCDRCKVDVEDVFGQTPLMKAVVFDDVDIIKILYKSGANLDSKDQMGRTALLASLQDGKIAAAKYLIKRGCDVNVVDNCNQSALYFTINNKQKYCLKTIQRLLKSGYKMDKDRKWMEEDGFQIRIIKAEGLCTKILGKIRGNVNKVKADRSKRSSTGLPMKVLTIYT